MPLYLEFVFAFYDILIYNKDLKEHSERLRQILKVLKENYFSSSILTASLGASESTNLDMLYPIMIFLLTEGSYKLSRNGLYSHRPRYRGAS